LGQLGSGIFFARGLDYPNQFDPIEQIALLLIVRGRVFFLLKRSQDADAQPKPAWRLRISSDSVG
jgi:hypothetical protein